MTSLSHAQALAEYERQAIEAMNGGRPREALLAWQRVLELRPDHAAALTQVGQEAFKGGDFAAARVAFQRAAQADGRDARQWVNLALACQRLGDDAAEEEALFRAAAADPSDLLALFLRGNLYERQGKTHRAAGAYGAAAAVAPAMDRLLPELRPAVSHAIEYRDRYQNDLAAAVDGFLEPHLRELDGASLARFKLSLDILLGRKRRFDSQPMRYFVPGLPAIEFFDREHFPWIEELEAETDAIRDEFLAVLRADQGFEPYIRYGQDEPVAQWAELNHSPRWSAFHLWKDGQPVSGNVERCPRTVAAWRKIPSPDQPGRTPVAMYSLLKPRTHIPPHVGASNARLVCHLPLIVPAGCRFRVGNTVREWAPGRVWVFDDTIEHEAWNDSDELRVVLIFDTWHPMIAEPERRMITAMNEALNHFGSINDVYDV
ncbi:aspartyl/asparaginyl beta-hydroxylase domain-containing protein [Aquincola sp. S2]|uniref:Aspartyl/asparaginyl beta-hydroxylase domain-containing protein n=1 Tax=Pseudaquabacterium terrae TaxID=2732868 RepID=A0ABX2EN75_9BURK|nr:aspartyl/asparaginyl beta-hydroxylase domain-containing protein [Aquabacterium terrae]NRF70068.1 aspartyl/asparaginyl beta-hydroxylase domain-containing protein [Aquabacterium terrae]